MPETKTTSKQWYIVHTYSGFEKKVSESLRQRAKAYDLEDQIGRIEIPTEEVVEMKGGKKVQTATRFFPGYILVEIETEEGAAGEKKIPDGTWHLVKNTPKVTGFVGSGNRPVPLSPEEADQIFVQVKESIEKPKPKYTFERGEGVRIIDGPVLELPGRGGGGQPRPQHPEGDGHDLRAVDPGGAGLPAGGEALRSHRGTEAARGR